MIFFHITNFSNFLKLARLWRALGAPKARQLEAKFHIEVGAPMARLRRALGAPTSIWMRIWLILKKMKIQKNIPNKLQNENSDQEKI